MKEKDVLKLSQGLMMLALVGEVLNVVVFWVKPLEHMPATACVIAALAWALLGMVSWAFALWAGWDIGQGG